MSKAKVYSIEADITTSLEGSIFKTFYRKKLWKTEDLTIAALIKADLNTYIVTDEIETANKERDEETIETTDTDAAVFAQIYVEIYKKYTNLKRNYKKGTKYWDDFHKAAALAKFYKVTPSDWVHILFTHYSKARREDKLSIPFTNQLHGDKAVDIVLQTLAQRGEVEAPAEVLATRQALTKRFVKLEDDQEYQKIMAKFKARTYTRKEFEYVKVRQTQVLGQPSDWLAKYDSILKDKEKARDEEA